MVAAAIGWWRAQLATSEVPDTGTLRGDIEALIVMVPDFGDAERQTISVILGAATAASRDPALAAALDEHVLGRSREVLGCVLARAVARGEIPPGRDLTLVPDVLLGLNALRLVTGRPAGRPGLHPKGVRGRRPAACHRPGARAAACWTAAVVRALIPISGTARERASYLPERN